MAEQNLDVKVTESGTAVVTSELSKLAGQLDKVTAAQEKEAAAATRAASASEKTAAGVEAFLKAQESKFAVVDRVAGLLGKFNLALDLVNKAYQLGKVIVEDYIQKQQALAPVLEDTNKKLSEQAALIKKIREAPQGVAGAAGASLAGLTTEQVAKAQAIAAEREQLEAEITTLQDKGGRVRGDLAEARNLGARRSVFLLEGEVRQVDKRLSEIDKRMVVLRDSEKRLTADVAGRGQPFETFGPEAPEKAAGRGGGGGGGDPEAELDALAADAAARLAEAMGPGMSGIAAQLPVMQEFATATFDAAHQIDNLAASYEAAATQAGMFAEATGKSALASAAAALVAGESVAAALQATLESKGIEAGVEALWTLGKALYYSVIDPPLAGPLFASAGYFAATATAAGIGSAIAGGIAGSGGGGGGGGRAPGPRDVGPRREGGSEASGPTTINVQIDGLSLSTSGQVGEAVMGAMERLRNTPGQRSRFERIINGGGR